MLSIYQSVSCSQISGSHWSY